MATNLATYRSLHPRRVAPGSREALAGTVAETITLLGEDVRREGLLRTPERVADSLRFLTQGYEQSVDEVIGEAVFAEDYSEMVLVKDIEVYSLCEHHMLPFFGKAHVAYIPDGRIVGLSKLPRLVETFARRLQVQERLTEEVARTLFKVLKPKGVGVVMEAEHLCVSMRGVKNETAFATTSSMLGAFRTDSRVRQEFLNLIKK